jgi:hypothetical protein
MRPSPDGLLSAPPPSSVRCSLRLGWHHDITIWQGPNGPPMALKRPPAMCTLRPLSSHITGIGAVLSNKLAGQTFFAKSGHLRANHSSNNPFVLRPHNRSTLLSVYVNDKRHGSMTLGEFSARTGRTLRPSYGPRRQNGPCLLAAFSKPVDTARPAAILNPHSIMIDSSRYAPFVLGMALKNLVRFLRFHSSLQQSAVRGVSR